MQIKSRTKENISLQFLYVDITYKPSRITKQKKNENEINEIKINKKHIKTNLA